MFDIIFCCYKLWQSVREVLYMSISYKKLWKLIIDKDMTNVEVRKVTGISPATFTKLKKNEMVSLEVLVKICKVLQCEIGDIIEIAYNTL